MEKSRLGKNNVKIETKLFSFFKVETIMSHFFA